MAYSVAALTIFKLPMTGKNLLALFLCILALLLTACGQRGPLYLPEPSQETPTQEIPEDEDQEEQDEETS